MVSVALIALIKVDLHSKIVLVCEHLKNIAGF